MAENETSVDAGADAAPRTRTTRPLTEVGIMEKIEGLIEPLPTDAAQRVVLYFAARVGFDIRPLLLNGTGEKERVA